MNLGKTILAIAAATLQSTAQETVEIQITRLGVPRTIEVDRDIRQLDLGGSALTSIILPDGLNNLASLDLSYNQLTSLTLPNGLTNLVELELYDNQLTSLTLPEGLTNLVELELARNRLTSFTLPKGLTNLTNLGLSQNQLTNFTLPEGLTNLEYLVLGRNQLTNLFLSPDTASHQPWLELCIAANPWMRIRQLVGLDTKFDVGPEHYGISYYDLPDSPKISRVENGLEISWSDGVLQASADVDGPWQDVHLPSPVRLRWFLISSIPAEFFRVRSKEQ